MENKTSTITSDTQMKYHASPHYPWDFVDFRAQKWMQENCKGLFFVGEYCSDMYVSFELEDDRTRFMNEIGGYELEDKV